MTPSQRCKRLLEVQQRIDAYPANTTPKVVAAFVDAAVVGSAASLVFTSLIPRVATAGADTPILRALINEIRAQRPLLDPDGHALPSIVPQLLAQYSASVQLGSDVPPADRVENVLDAVRYCLSFDCPGLAGELIGRVVKPDSTVVDKEYIMDTLEPVPAGLPLILRRKNMLLSSNFTPHIGSILLYWGTTIMGPPSGGITASRQALKEFEAWQCACEHCVSVRGVMVDEPEVESESWGRIGAPQRKRLDQCIKAYASALATPYYNLDDTSWYRGGQRRRNGEAGAVGNVPEAGHSSSQRPRLGHRRALHHPRTGQRDNCVAACRTARHCLILV